VPLGIPIMFEYTSAKLDKYVVNAFAFCRSLLIVARFYVSRVCILSLAVDH
jgi:hypothetical protein